MKKRKRLALLFAKNFTELFIVGIIIGAGFDFLENISTYKLGYWGYVVGAVLGIHVLLKTWVEYQENKEEK